VLVVAATGDATMPTLTHTAPTEEADETEELAPDSQFESFYDPESGTWTLRRIPSTPPACADDDAA
jgi:hypothetical protein